MNTPGVMALAMLVPRFLASVPGTSPQPARLGEKGPWYGVEDRKMEAISLIDIPDNQS